MSVDLVRLESRYSSELTALQETLREHRDQLAPETVRILEENPRIIDDAIQEARSALANDPQVLLLDEPASALDPIATQKIEELVYELKREITIVIVTHNLQQAARIADQTAFFYLGRLVEMGDTQRLFTSPREQRTEAYITGRFG